MISRETFQSLFARPPALLDRLEREPRVLLRGHLHQPVAGRVGAVVADEVERVDSVPSDFDILRPSWASTVEWMITSRKGMSRRARGREDHPVLPETNDLACRDVEVAGVEPPEIGRVVRPPERRKRPECRREPRVQDVRVALELGRGALRARLGLGLRDRDVAVRAVPDGQLVPPPDLA